MIMTTFNEYELLEIFESFPIQCDDALGHYVYEHNDKHGFTISINISTINQTVIVILKYIDHIKPLLNFCFESVSCIVADSEKLVLYLPEDSKANIFFKPNFAIYLGGID